MNTTQTPIQPLMSERRVSIIGACLVVVGPVSMALYTPSMTEIVNAFGTTEAMVKMTLALYFAGFACAQLVAGPVSDALGRRPVTLWFMGIYLVASVMAFLAPNIEMLLFARFLQGVGASVGIAISRAIVRDLFTDEKSSRIMNLIGIILAIGPALAPTIGGLTMIVAGWRAVFGIMVLLGINVILVTLFVMKETVIPDRTRLRFSSLMTSYRTLLVNRHFMTTAGILAGSIGAVYAQSVFLPFILMNRVGLSPTEFGLSMIIQSGSFFAGSLVARSLMARTSAYNLVAPGLCLVAIGGLGIAMLGFWEPSFLHVMVPVGFYAFGIAHVMPAITTASLAPFPHIAGAASSLSGFFQMGAGLVVGAIGALFGDPVTAMAILVPLMGFGAIGCYLVYRLHPHIAEPEPRPGVIAGLPPGRATMQEQRGMGRNLDEER